MLGHFAKSCAGILIAASILTCAADGQADTGDAKIDRLPDLLAQFEMDEKFFARFTDGESLRAEEIPLVAPLLYRLRQIPQAELDRWSARGAQASAYMDVIGNHRGELVAVPGQVTFVSRQTLEQEVAKRFDLQQLFLCNFETDDGRELVVLSPRVPRSWHIGKPVSYQSECQAVLLKQTLLREHELPLALTAHVAWYPPTVLGALGMDESLLQDLQNRKPIRSQERECFYQLLAAVGRAKPGELESSAAQRLAGLRKSLPHRIDSETDAQQKAILQHSLERAEQQQSDVVPLFNQPERQHGQLMLLEGIARRAVEIRVDDADVVERFGIRRYYEVEIFTSDSQNNPITVCTVELPDNLPLGDNLYERVRTAAFFFKVWSYPLGRVEQQGDRLTKSQLAPLLMARRIEWLATETPPAILSEVVPLAILGLISITILFVAIRIARSSQRARRATSASGLADEVGARATLASLESSEPRPRSS